MATPEEIKRIARLIKEDIDGTSVPDQGLAPEGINYDDTMRNLVKKLRTRGWGIERTAYKSGPDEKEILYFNDGTVVFYDRGENYVAAQDNDILASTIESGQDAFDNEYISEADFFTNIFDEQSSVYEYINENDPLVTTAKSIPGTNMTPEEEESWNTWFKKDNEGPSNTERAEANAREAFLREISLDDKGLTDDEAYGLGK